MVVSPPSLPSRAAARSQLDRPLFCLLQADGALCAAQVRQGVCVLLFTSAAAATAFADSVGIAVRPPRVFSRGRAEFLTQAGRSAREGFIGGLIDTLDGARETAFLGFDVDRRQSEQ